MVPGVLMISQEILMTSHIPVENPKPDIHRFLSVLSGEREGCTPPLVEYIIDPTVMKPIVTGLLDREWVESGPDRASQAAHLDNFIDFWYRMGYDFVRLEIGMGFKELGTVVDDAAPQSEGKRSWVNQHEGAIRSWEDLERYAWPKAEDVDFFPLEYVLHHLPEGMGFLTCHAGGVFEHISQIMSIEGLCMALCEAPDLVQAVADKVGEGLEAYYRHLLDMDGLTAIFQGDDMGFRTQTLVGPDEMRRYSLTRHKRLAQMTHESGRPYFLHSCGNLETIMDDLIKEVGIDGKHSYEDAIIPVEDFQATYGDRIAVLGGLDLNILSGGTPEEVRARTRFLVETCGERGRYAIGSGNSVPSYVPPENYLAMIDEAHACRGTVD